MTGKELLHQTWLLSSELFPLFGIHSAGDLWLIESVASVFQAATIFFEQSNA